MNFQAPLRIIDDCPVWVKALAAPVFLMICFLGIGINAYLTLERSASGLTALSQAELPHQRMVSELTHDIMATQVLVSRYVTWATNGVNPEPLEELGREVIGTLDMLKERLRVLRARQDLSPVERDTVTELLAKWEGFHSAARNTVQVGASDAPMASMLLAGADDDFKSISIQLLILSAVVGNETRLVTHDITVAALKNKNILAIGGLLGVLASGLMTLLIARSIVTPIGAVTTAMQQVSAGRIEGRIGYTDRKDEIGQMVAAIAVFRQSIEKQNELLKDREAALEAQNLRFDAALANMSQGLSMFDSQQRVIICNERYGQMYGLSADQVKPGTPLSEIVEHRIAKGIFAFKDPEQYRRERLAPVSAAADKVLELSDGRSIAISQRPMPTGGWVTTHEDITERRRIEARIAHLAHHDALTDLPNRTLLRERLEQALTGERQEDRTLSVLMLDLDRFKEVNDTLGHGAGDALLKAVAERLLSCVRETDTVARLGGDEFAVVHSVKDGATDAAALAARIIERLSETFDLDGNQASIGTSIGITLAPADGTSPDQLLRNADLALYRSKSEGRGTYSFFEPGMDQRMQARRLLEADLRSALANNEFTVYYQPLVNVEKNEICGFEALLRWHHPVRGNVPPNDFISLAEETGLIIPIGDWVLRKACAEAASWPDHLKIAVNISPAQFTSRMFVASVISALAAVSMSASRLELEITEAVLLQDQDGAFATLTRLHDIGVRIALDDFGTGYSSLSNLRRFPFDKIKIDRSFVSDLSAANVDALAVVRSVTRLGVTLGMATTAEGVETSEQAEQVRAEGCTEMQGYFICPPSPAKDIAHLLSEPLRKPASAA
jgi:diguanylate cyclase (GGDEF)-like protein